MLQRRLNEEHPGAGDGDGGGPAFPAAARGKTAALSSVRPGQLRAGVASKRALLRFVGRRGPLPASLVGTGAAAAGGGGGGGSGGGGAAGEQGGADADGGGAAPAAATVASAPSAGGGSDGIPEPAEGPGDLFQFYRLLLPSLDDERGRRRRQRQARQQQQERQQQPQPRQRQGRPSGSRSSPRATTTTTPSTPSTRTRWPRASRGPGRCCGTCSG